MHWSGTLHVEADLDLPDALDLDHTLAAKAAEAKALGSAESLDVRRAKALGDLARTQTSLDLTSDLTSDTAVDDDQQSAESEDRRSSSTRAPASGVSRPLPAARQLVLYLHLSADAVSALHPGTADGLIVDPLAGLDNGQRLILLEQVKDWAEDTLTDVAVKPVVDLGEEIATDAYTPTGRQREQVILRDRTCIHPWCTRPARLCDLEHVVPFDHDAKIEGRPQPGPTTTSNLGAMCRGHHRLKTHGRWRVQALSSGVFLWTSSHGHRFLRDRTGTTALPDSTGDPDPPPRP